MQQDQSKLPLQPAPIPARVLALLLDMLLVHAIFLSTASLLAYDFAFLVPFLFSCIYFPLGNSGVGRGRTFGKRVFGLQTVVGGSNANKLFLSLPESFFRYLLSLGFIVIVVEVSDKLYRATALEAPRAILDLPILLIITVLTANIICFFAHPHHRALHDILIKSTVIRTPSPLTLEELRKQLRSLFSAPSEVLEKRALKAAIFGSILSALVWGFMVSLPSTTEPFQRVRYLIEHELSIRILSLYVEGDTVFIEAVELLSADNPPLGAQALALSLMDKYKRSGAFENGLIKHLKLAVIQYKIGTRPEGEAETVRLAVDEASQDLHDDKSEEHH